MYGINDPKSIQKQKYKGHDCTIEMYVYYAPCKRGMGAVSQMSGLGDIWFNEIEDNQNPMYLTLF